MNKRLLSMVALGAVLMLSACSETTPSSSKVTKVNYVENAEIQAKGMKQIKGLIDGVKPALMTTLKSDKTGIEGMEMCSTSAMEMGKKYNASLPKDSKVRRTALKYRNPNNKPDATDVVVMTKLKADNTFKKPLVVDMGDSYRVYKALPVHKPCLICHGDTKKMSPSMLKSIKEKYPKDLASNFKEHEFRGVIVSTIKK
jgi:predicted component of type VI protein secretion system